METKKKGRPAGINYDVSKIVKISNKQNKNWNRNTPKAIRDLLEGNLVSIELLKQLHSIMDNRMDFTEKPTDSEQEIIVKIEELIK